MSGHESPTRGTKVHKIDSDRSLLSYVGKTNASEKTSKNKKSFLNLILNNPYHYF
jgi:hypothetical protein